MNPPKLNAGLAGLSLHIGSPKQTDMALEQKPLSVPGMFTNIPVEQIDCYDHNPRRKHDPEQYAMLKESIRASGVKQPVHVTQRPNQQRYILSQGGNTRLQIVKELFAETGDSRFATLPCIYQGYTGETDIQIAHLIENEQRADMCYWDKACAYAQLRNGFQLSECKNLSLRELELLFKNCGLSLSYQSIALFLFAHDRLAALGDCAFHLSGSKVIELKKLHGKLMQAVTRQQCSEADADEAWDLALGDWSAQFEAAQELDIDALLAHIRVHIADVLDLKQFQSETADAAAGRKAAAMPPNTDADAGDWVQPAQQAALAEDKENENETGPEEVSPLGAALQGVNPPAKQETSAPDSEAPPETPKATRNELHLAIRRLLRCVGLEDTFHLHDGFDWGFYIEYPAFEMITPQAGVIYPIDCIHADAGYVFTWVSQLSGQEMWLRGRPTDRNNPLPHLPEDSKLRIAYKDEHKLDEYSDLGIGLRPDLAMTVLAWQTEPECQAYGTLIDTIIACLRDLKERQD